MNHPDLASTPNLDVARKGPQGLLDAIVVIGSLTTAAIAMTKFRDAIAGLLGGVPEWIVPALSGALALLFIVWFVIVPRLRAARRDQRLKRILAGMHRVPPGAFRLTPFTDSEQDQRAFNRADGEHVRILNWFKRSDETLLYLMGRSGVGKSSLLNAYVLPHLFDDFRIIHLRGVRAPLGRLRDALLKPENIWQDPSGKEVLSTLDLLSSAAEHVTRRGGRKGLLLVFDQFEELLILHERESKAVADVIELLQSCLQDPTAGLQILLVMRSDYDGRLRDLGLPTLRQGENYEIVPRLDEPTATQYLDGVIKNKEIATLLVREAAEVEEARGRLRFITLNFLGRVYKDSPRLVHSGRGTASLLKAQIARWMNEPSIREVAPQVVRDLISDQDTKRPRTLAEISGDTGLSTVRIEHCLRTLENDGVVRVAGEFWEISHDFLARLGAAVARQLEKSLARRLRPFIGPAFVAAWLITVLGASSLWLAREREYEHRSWEDAGGRIKVIDGSSPRRYRVSFEHPGAAVPAALRYLARQSERQMIAVLDLTECDILTSLEGMPELPQLEMFDLSSCDHLTLLEGMPELPQLTELNLSHCDGLTSLEGMSDELAQLTELNLSNCDGLTSLEGMPGELAKLTKLDLWSCDGLTSLEGMSDELAQLTEFNLSGCDGLTSPEGMPDALAKLIEFKLSQCGGLTSLEGMPDELPQLTRLGLDGCRALTSLKGLPYELPQLTALKLIDCTALASLEGMPAELPNLTALDLSPYSTAFTRLAVLMDSVELPPPFLLTSLEGMPRALPQLTRLEFSWCPALTSLQGMPDALPNLTKLRLRLCTALASLAGMPNELPKLATLDLQTCTALTSLEAMPDELPQLTAINLRDCSGLTSLDGLPELPKLSKIDLSGCRGLTDVANLYDTNRYPALETVVLDADIQNLWDSTRRPGVTIELRTERPSSPPERREPEG